MTFPFIGHSPSKLESNKKWARITVSLFIVLQGCSKSSTFSSRERLSSQPIPTEQIVIEKESSDQTQDSTLEISTNESIDDIVEVEIKIENQNEKLKIQISNTGKLFNPKEKNGDGTHTGIKNLKNRLKYLDKDFQFKLFEKENKVVASLVLSKCSNYENMESNNS